LTEARAHATSSYSFIGEMAANDKRPTEALVPPMADDVLSDQFPVSSAAVPLSDSLRTIRHGRSVWSSPTVPTSPFFRWVRGDFGVGGGSLTPGSSQESLDISGREPLGESPLKMQMGAIHSSSPNTRPTSPTRFFSALDLSSFEQKDRRQSFETTEVYRSQLDLSTVPDDMLTTKPSSTQPVV